MTKNQEIYRKQLLARIHLNSQYKLIKENGAWEDWLSLRFGVSSAALLSINELKLVLDILCFKKEDKLEFKPDRLGRNLVYNAENKQAKKENKKISTAQFKRIVELSKILKMDERRLLMFCIKQARILIPDVENIKNINAKKASNIIFGLEKIIKHKSNKGELA